jgi:hypothetical protein
VNDFLELSQVLADTGWIYLCIVGAAALGLLVFDRDRKRRATGLTVVPGLRTANTGLIRDTMDGSEIDADAPRAKSA